MATTQQSSHNGPDKAKAMQPGPKPGTAPVVETKPAPLAPEPTKMDAQPATETAAKPEPKPEKIKLSPQDALAALKEVLRADVQIAELEGKRGVAIQKLMDSYGDDGMFIGSKVYKFRKRQRTTDEGVVKFFFYVDITEPVKFDPSELKDLS